MCGLEAVAWRIDRSPAHHGRIRDDQHVRSDALRISQMEQKFAENSGLSQEMGWFIDGYRMSLKNSGGCR